MSKSNKQPPPPLKEHLKRDKGKPAKKKDSDLKHSSHPGHVFITPTNLHSC